MYADIPPFDTDALRDNAENFRRVATQEDEERIIDALITDQIAAADHIDLLTAALKGQAA